MSLKIVLYYFVGEYDFNSLQVVIIFFISLTDEFKQLCDSTKQPGLIFEFIFSSPFYMSVYFSHFQHLLQNQWANLTKVGIMYP